jgi:hypothetical protein
LSDKAVLLPYAGFVLKPDFEPSRHRQVVQMRAQRARAIANGRLLDCRDGRVSFRWKDYRAQNKSKAMTLGADEFMRRFLMHVLPKGFRRIRHFGFLPNACRAEKLARIRAALAFPKPERPTEPKITANAAYSSPASASTFALSAEAEWSTSAHGCIALRHGQLPTATPHDVEPADHVSASDQHHRARGAAPDASKPASCRSRQECRPTIPNKTVAESSNLATATRQTSPRRQIEARPSAFKGAFINPRP